MYYLEMECCCCKNIRSICVLFPIKLQQKKNYNLKFKKKENLINLRDDTRNVTYKLILFTHISQIIACMTL